MILTFRHKGLEKFYRTGSNAGIIKSHEKRLRLILGRLNASTCPEDMNLPGLRLHSLRGQYKSYWAVNVSANWRIIFRFRNGDSVFVDYLDYH